MKGIIINAAGILSFLNLAWFAIKVWNKKVEANSTASWLMWVILDTVVLGSTAASGKSIALAASYVAGASMVFAAHLKHGKWVWTWVETLSAIGATVAAILWQTLSPEAGVIAGIVAMTAAGVPILVFFCKSPDRGAAAMFGVTTFACLITLLASLPWSIGGCLLSAGGFVYNGLMSSLAIRDRR